MIPTVGRLSMEKKGLRVRIQGLEHRVSSFNSNVQRATFGVDMF